MSRKTVFFIGAALAVGAIAYMRWRSRSVTVAAKKAKPPPSQESLSIDVDLGEPVLMGHFGRVHGNTGVVGPDMAERAP